MSVFCISDIHGHADEFFNLLDKVSPTSDDEIYILGDIIDKGDGSARMLKWAIDEAPDNFHFLIGNHEDMAFCVLNQDPINMLMRMRAHWSYNDGFNTARQLMNETTPEWRADKLVPWLKNLPIFETVDVNGERFMLVHAGFDCTAYNENAMYMFIDGIQEHDARRNILDLSQFGFGQQFEQDMLWSRFNWLSDGVPAPMPTVFGHTYMDESRIEKTRAIIEHNFHKIPQINGGSGKMFRIWNKYNIDCGCAYSEQLGDRWNLLMLRLDDMEEFYAIER